MVYLHTGRNRPLGQFVGHPVNPDCHGSRSGPRGVAILVRRSVSSPFPAIAPWPHTQPHFSERMENGVGTAAPEFHSGTPRGFSKRSGCWGDIPGLPDEAFRVLAGDARHRFLGDAREHVESQRRPMPRIRGFPVMESTKWPAVIPVPKTTGRWHVGTFDGRRNPRHGNHVPLLADPARLRPNPRHQLGTPHASDTPLPGSPLFRGDLPVGGAASGEWRPATDHRDLLFVSMKAVAAIACASRAVIGIAWPYFLLWAIP